ncbi:hypothetical protein Psch_02221 [Pelotomaculum schinkii]|uniref:HTH merR-type domain-containing protein n=1 Tax=Pelotomaculum schinkii TaxID=78350 RepID=A0A4Y7RI42_9FIRM|nr:MerR family transcriptional regulator [Pelotomaculum schinkii]TEB08654.1 hypothetical protein Psch_02221 [Pelotomaculum schinkii]
MVLKQGFRSSEVSVLTGLTQRQIDYWDRNGLFKPSLAQAAGRGSARFYSYLDLVELKIVKRLLDAGLSTKLLKDCLLFLKNNLHEKALSGVSLISDGRGLFLLSDNPIFAIDLAKKGQVVWLIDIQQAADEVKKSCEEKLSDKNEAIS